MTKLLVTVLAIAVLATGAAWAGPGETAARPPSSSADVVKVVPVPARLAAAAGERVEFKLNLHIQQKWHLYAHGDTSYIGIDLLPAEDFPLTELGIVYPEGHLGTIIGDPVIMLEGDEVIAVTGAVRSDLPAGDHALTLALTVQACDDKSCLRPSDVPVILILTVK